MDGCWLFVVCLSDAEVQGLVAQPTPVVSSGCPSHLMRPATLRAQSTVAAALVYLGSPLDWLTVIVLPDPLATGTLQQRRVGKSRELGRALEREG